MAEISDIEWTDATWNPITGCSVVSPGCTNRYAMRLAGTRLKDHPSREGLTYSGKAGPVWTGEVRFNEVWLDQPWCWRNPRMIFVCAHGDLFHERVPDEWIDRVFQVMEAADWHTYQVLTKRSGRQRDYLIERYRDCKPPAHIWLGVSVEDQRRANERIPDLLATPAAVRWISAEPLLGPVDIQPWLTTQRSMANMAAIALRGQIGHPARSSFISTRLDWVVVGGESGPGARPMHPHWVRRLRDDCEAEKVPFFFKQWGEWGVHGQFPIEAITSPPVVKTLSLTGEVSDPPSPFNWTICRIGKRAAGALLDGRHHHEWPRVSR